MAKNWMEQASKCQLVQAKKRSLGLNLFETPSGAKFKALAGRIRPTGRTSDTHAPHRAKHGNVDLKGYFGSVNMPYLSLRSG